MGKINYTGMKFNEWTILKKLTNGKYLCRCSCGVEKEQFIKHLISGSSKSCGHTRNIEGKKFGSWTVIKELGKGKVLCLCDCGTEKELYKKALVTGQTKSCGCEKYSYRNDLIGKKFGEWTVVEFVGNTYWKCKCSCGKEGIVSRKLLLDGKSKSCGCKQGQNLLNTMLDNYGDITSQRIENPRELWQIETLNNKELLENYLVSLGHKPTIKELCILLDTKESTVLLRVHKYKLEDLVIINPMHSEYENEIVKFIEDLDNNIIIYKNDRNVLNGLELDIYIPDKKLAIEFNGSYWHSDIYKDKIYHQYKTLECAKRGIRLIHIFEYEWQNQDIQDKLKNMIKSIIIDIGEYIGARDTVVKEIDSIVAKDFLNKYHIQCNISSHINIGCIYNDELIGLMTFGKPRFNKNYEYELIRFCWKTNVRVIGGAEKLFSYFVKTYNPLSIVTYSDISKFTGNTYLKLGFKVDEITTPNYKWVDISTNNVLSRYQTQKNKLIEQGLGTVEQTETEIMHSLGYIKIYDSGNLKLKYQRKGDNYKIC